MSIFAQRLGQVFGAEMGPDWMASHAAYPAPIQMKDGEIRVFFIARDTQNRGVVGWVDLDAKDPTKVLAVSDAPALEPGPAGSFDARGIAIGNLLGSADQLEMYYMGWGESPDAQFRNSVGRAVSTDGGASFVRSPDAAVLPIDATDRYSMSYPFVWIEGRARRALYGTHHTPGVPTETMVHPLASAQSEDGLVWDKAGDTVLPLYDGELGHSRPWIFTIGGARWLLFSARYGEYEMHLAREADGGWDRAGALRFDGPVGDWEGPAQCYGAVWQGAEGSYLFYNGQGYGRTGFGAARLEQA